MRFRRRHWEEDTTSSALTPSADPTRHDPILVAIRPSGHLTTVVFRHGERVTLNDHELEVLHGYEERIKKIKDGGPGIVNGLAFFGSFPPAMGAGVYTQSKYHWMVQVAGILHPKYREFVEMPLAAAATYLGWLAVMLPTISVVQRVREAKARRAMRKELGAYPGVYYELKEALLDEKSICGIGTYSPRSRLTPREEIDHGALEESRRDDTEELPVIIKGPWRTDD